MKKLVFFASFLVQTLIFAQSNFTTEAYQTFLNSVTDLSYKQLADMHPLKNDYFKDFSFLSCYN